MNRMNNAGSRSGRRRRKKLNSGSRESEKEALLIYQITVQEQSLNERLFEVDFLEQENDVNNQRIGQLKCEQEKLMKTILIEEKVRKISSEKSNSSNRFNKDFMIEQLKKKLALKEKCQKCLRDLENLVKEKEDQIRDVKSQLNDWFYFMETGQQELLGKISQLELSIVHEKEKYQFMKEHLEGQSSSDREKLQEETMKELSKHKIVMAQKAVKNMNKLDQQQLADNEWLIREVGMYKQELKRMQNEIETLTEENLNMLQKLQQQFNKDTFNNPFVDNKPIDDINNNDINQQQHNMLKYFDDELQDIIHDSSEKLKRKDKTDDADDNDPKDDDDDDDDGVSRDKLAWPVTRKMLVNKLKSL